MELVNRDLSDESAKAKLAARLKMLKPVDPRYRRANFQAEYNHFKYTSLMACAPMVPAALTKYIPELTAEPVASVPFQVTWPISADAGSVATFCPATL